MKPAFRLDQYPRRAQPPLSEPPAGYFEQLPRRVMARLPQPEAESTGWAGLLFLPPLWRTSLAASALLVSFAASFWLSAPGGGSGASAPLASLDAVPQTELVGYLLGPEASVETADLADLAAAHPELSSLSSSVLRASDAEILDALDAQPEEEPALL